MILKSIIDRLNQRIEVSNIFDRIYGLCELTGDKGWIYYIGDGQAIPVTDYDSKQGSLFWAKRGKVNISKIDSLRVSGCKQMYSTKFNLSAYAIVRKSHLPCDGEDAADWVASRVYKLVSGRDYGFKEVIDVVSYEVIPNGYTVGDKTLPENLEFATVVIDLEVEIVSGSEDTCYDICNTGDIPLPPDFLPCTPCLTEVAVDGVTIIGNGTPADPLVAIGGGGGTPLRTQDEGANVSTNTTTLNFTGAGVTASLTSPGVVEVNIPSGGGGGEDLQQTTDIGNSTTNDIDFIGNAGLAFDNGARFRKGTTDAGLGGAKGTAQLCSISYELKWEAGRLYYMEQDGFTIRDVTHNFTFVPQPTDDSTKGFVVGSRWSLDDGTVYLCSDATIGAAVWTVVSSGGVTNVTATSPIFSSGGATPDISIQPASSVDDGYLTSADWNTFDGKFDQPTGTNADYLDGTGTPTPFPTLTNGTVTSVGATVPNPTNPAFSVNVPNPSTTPSVDITANGLVSQYVRGDGSLANFPASTGGGASVSYYLNGSINQGTFGGSTYYEMNRVPIIGTGTNFTRTNAQGNGYIAQFLTDAGDPNLLNIPGGNWNVETYLSASSGGGNPSFYVELYKFDGTTFTLIASGSPESITGGTAVDLYTSAIAVPQTTLLATDRLAVRIFVTTSGRNITLHTEDNNLCQVITTFTTGLTALNGLTEQVQSFATGTTGTDFGITSAAAVHTFNLPTASATNRGALSSGDWSAFNSKEPAIASGTTSQYWRGDKSWQTLDKSAVGLSNVDNTSDANKPISNATQTALNGKFNNPTGNTSQYIRGDGSLQTFPSVGTGTVTSVGLSMPAAFSVANSPVTSSGTLTVTGAGTTAQYIRGDGSLATYTGGIAEDQIILLIQIFS